MSALAEGRTARVIDPRDRPTLDVLGPTLQFLTPRGDDGAPCVIRGTIPPGGAVPLHSHADPETFLMVAGSVEGLTETPDGFAWVGIAPGDIFHVPGHAKHAFRNRATTPSAMIIVSTARMRRFFEEVGTPATAGPPPGPPTDEAIRRFLETATRYGYWNATAEENAEVGLYPAAA